MVHCLSETKWSGHLDGNGSSLPRGGSEAGEVGPSGEHVVAPELELPDGGGIPKIAEAKTRRASSRPHMPIEANAVKRERQRGEGAGQLHGTLLTVEVDRPANRLRGTQ